MAESVAASRLPLLVAAGVAGILVVGTSILWMRYGTTVFFEMIRAGFVACFG